jgi:glycosyltransferase involved in cell wall biosynthesis
MKNKTKIYFLENSFNYNGSDLNSDKIGGSEKTLINIANALSADNNLIIKVYNNTLNEKFIKNVNWSNINSINYSDRPDFLIAMSDVNLFKKLNCKNNYLWSHSIQSIEKFIRKKQLFSFIKYKPVMILEGDYHNSSRNFFTSFYGKKVLKIAVDDDFINHKINSDEIPSPNAIFTTKSDRNMNFLLNSWHEIKKKSQNAQLLINPPYMLSEINRKDSVHLRVKSDKKLLIKDLIRSRLFITPGHKTEVFCLAAEEAKELCIPIVTMGYGCLYERVDHGVTGFIASNKKEFIDYSIRILNDDKLYMQLKKNMINLKNSRNYSDVKNDLINILNNND